jgi:hypothetical protein
MSEETIQGEHRKPLFQRLRDICGCLTTEDDCDEIARVVFKSYTVVFESYPTNEKMSEEIKYQYHSGDLSEDPWISFPNNGGEVGDLHDIAEELNRLYKIAESYDHLVESLPKSKRPFSDKQAQKVIASQVKRITQLEDDLSFVRCELDKLRKETR